MMIRWKMKIAIYVLVLLICVGGAFACKDVYDVSERVNITDVIEEEGVGAVCNLTLYRGVAVNQSGNMSRTGLAYGYDAGFLEAGVYSASIDCQVNSTEYRGECKFSVEEDVGMLGFFILIPLILAGLLVWGAGSMDGDEHPVFKWFLFLLAPLFFFVALWFGMLMLVKYYDFPELQNAIGDVVYWFGIVWGVMVVYFIIYGIYKMVHVAAQKRKERLEY